jgi:hypothetical protein
MCGWRPRRPTVPEVYVYIKKEVQFMLAENEWFERHNLIVVQVEASIFGSGRESVRTFAVLPTETEKYKRGDIGPRGYKNVALTEAEQAEYLAQAHAAIEAQEKEQADA